MSSPQPTTSSAIRPSPARWLLGSLALVSFLLVFHNYGYPLLPRQRIDLSADQITPLAGGPPHVFVIACEQSEPNRPFAYRSAVILLEDGIPYRTVQTKSDELFLHGGVRMMHEPGRILFATKYNSDPRTNGHHYTLLVPILYNRQIGQIALLVLALSIAALYWRLKPSRAEATAKSGQRWGRHVTITAALLLIGLYCNTGTLSPYAITTFPYQSPETGYLYNPDHEHFRVLYQFVSGADHSVWDQAIMLRRILFPVLAWPFMAWAGFEIGGTLASLCFNLLGFLAAGWILRRKVGERGAIFALWLMALYPGAAYWGGLPYPYALITPISLLLLLALVELQTANGLKFVGLSLSIGISYLAYDFIMFFLPASLLLLLWQRRLGALITCAIGQLLPLALWIIAIATVFGQNLSNSNSQTYAAILTAYRHIKSAELWANATTLVESGATLFFGSNFIFLPGLFLFLLILNPLTAKIRLNRPEICLLLAAFSLFLFNNLAPEYGGWQMRGTWIARIYQPIFPVFILFAARWWQHLPRLSRPLHGLIFIALVGFSLGQLLIIFGPILGNPGRVSESAFYRFYNHNDNHWVYEEICLKNPGRYPLGFRVPRP